MEGVKITSISEAAPILDTLQISPPPGASERWEVADSSGCHSRPCQDFPTNVLLISIIPLRGEYDLFCIHFMIGEVEAGRSNNLNHT